MDSPRQRSFCCLSLKAGSILTALLYFLDSLRVLVLYIAALCILASETGVNEWIEFDEWHKPHLHYYSYGLMMAKVIAVIVTHSWMLFLTALMLVGVLREKLNLIRLWEVFTRIQLWWYLVFTVRWAVKNFTYLSDGITFLMFAVWCLSLLFRLYLITRVAEYYKQLEKKQVDGKRGKTLVNQDTSA